MLGADADVLVHDGGAGIDDPATAGDKRVRSDRGTFQTFTETPSQGRRRRIHLRFLTSPVEILGDGRVSGIVVEPNRRDDGQVSGTGERSTLDVGLVISAVGFRGAPLPGLPFDDGSGTVPNESGRVIRDGSPVKGVYVAGWLKRGPSGIIGTNKPDGAQTAVALLDDLAVLPAVDHPDVLELLTSRSSEPVDWAGWLRLEDHEGTLGATEDRGRVKVHDLESMLRHCSAMSG